MQSFPTYGSGREKRFVRTLQNIHSGQEKNPAERSVLCGVLSSKMWGTPEFKNLRGKNHDAQISPCDLIE